MYVPVQNDTRQFLARKVVGSHESTRTFERLHVALLQVRRKQLPIAAPVATILKTTESDHIPVQHINTITVTLSQRWQCGSRHHLPSDLPWHLMSCASHRCVSGSLNSCTQADTLMSPLLRVLPGPMQNMPFALPVVSSHDNSIVQDVGQVFMDLYPALLLAMDTT